MTKINQEEYEILKGLDDRWKWIARDSKESYASSFSNKVMAYQTRPNKYNGLNIWSDGAGGNHLPKELLQFIQWGDREPYSIAELVEGYERESEEKEMKRNLKEAILGIEVIQFDGQKADLEELVDPRQLEETIDDWMPEVLSSNWIKDNQLMWTSIHGAEYYVPANKLYGKLMPKQEEADRAYKDGYEKRKQHTFYKGYIEGLADKESESETVSDVIVDFYKSLERLKEVLDTEVKELE